MQDQKPLRIYRDGALDVLPTLTNYAAHYLRNTLPASAEQVKQSASPEHKVTAYAVSAMLLIAVVNIVVA